jgi:cytoskeletal protein RodZ
MTDFGEKLRRQRESRNLTLREISESTKITKRYLEALERNDFDALPGGVFVKGYIRSYAEAIGLNPESLLEEYRSERRARGEEDPSEDEKVAKEAAQAAMSQLATSINRQGKERRLLLPIIIGLALLAIIIWAGIHFLSPGSTEEVTAKPEPAAVVEPIVEEATEPVAKPQPEPKAESPEPIVEQAAPPTQPVAVVKSEPAPEPDTETVAEVESVATDTSLTIPDYGVGTGLVNRELVGRSDTFREGDTVWFWTRVVGGKAGDSIRHVWLHDGVEAGVIGLNVGGAHWRTQSRRQMRQGSAGRWSVEARDAQGRLLARSEFSCISGE